MFTILLKIKVKKETKNLKISPKYLSMFSYSSLLIYF